MSRDITPCDIGPRVNAISGCEKNGIDVDRPTSFAREVGARAMWVDRNVMFGLIALIVIGLLAFAVEKLLY
jgi:hypothetical protein